MNAKNNMTPFRIITATEARNHFGEAIRRAYENGEDQIVTRSGLPIAAIISINKYLLLHPERVKDLSPMPGHVKPQKAV